jgi:hypothetical protein
MVIIIVQMMLKLLYTNLLQLYVYVFLLNNPTMIPLSMLHHHVNQLSFIHLLILVNMNLLLCLKLLQWYSSILYHLKLMFLFHPQSVQVEEQQQPLRQQSLSNDGAADVPQPLQPQAIATPSVCMYAFYH